jgi:hypothetical protein
MRFRRYLVLALASVTALAVAGVAYAHHGPGGNGGIKCTPTNFNTCEDNVSSLPTWNVTPGALPGTGGGGNGGTGATAAVGLDVQTHTNYSHPGDAAQGGKVANVQLTFDNDVVVSLAGIPSCTASFTAGTTIAQAWNACGPGAGSANNAYMSPSTGVSGTVSTAPPGNFGGCNLVFKKSATQLLLFARVTLSGPADCSNPAANNSGNTTTLLTGTLSSVSTPDYKTKLTVPLPSSIPVALDDFKSKVKRANVFKARCRDTNKLLHLKGRFQYTDSQTEQPPDTVTKSKACT